MSKPQRIVLPKEVSKQLPNAEALVVVGKASHPDDPNRYVLHVVPCTVENANKAARIALGDA